MGQPHSMEQQYQPQIASSKPFRMIAGVFPPHHKPQRIGLSCRQDIRILQRKIGDKLTYLCNNTSQHKVLHNTTKNPILHNLEENLRMIEVEIKCKPTPQEKEALLKDASFIGEEKLTDVYYDSATYELSLKDFWLRTRNDKFILKVPTASYAPQATVTNTSKHEIEDDQEIRSILKLEAHEPLQKALANAGYHPLYTLCKTRKKYTKAGFIIDIDHAVFEDFGFDLCEIETMVETPEETDAATQKLISFAQQHGLTLKPVPGNLIMLIKLINPEHARLLEAAHKKRIAGLKKTH